MKDLRNELIGAVMSALLGGCASETAAAVSEVDSTQAREIDVPISWRDGESPEPPSVMEHDPVEEAEPSTDFEIEGFSVSLVEQDYLEKVELSWNAPSADSCRLSSVEGALPARGRVAVVVSGVPGSVQTYELTCHRGDDVAFEAVEVHVRRHVVDGPVVVGDGSCGLVANTTLDAIAHVNEIRDGLVICGVNGSVELPKLVEITADGRPEGATLDIFGGIELRKISLPNLRSVSRGRIDIRTVRAPVTSVARGAVPALESFDLSGLAGAVSALRLDLGGYVGALEVPDLMRVDEQLTIGGTGCATADFRSLESVGFLEVSGASLTNLARAFPVLSRVSGAFSLEGPHATSQTQVELLCAQIGHDTVSCADEIEPWVSCE